MPSLQELCLFSDPHTKDDLLVKTVKYEKLRNILSKKDEKNRFWRKSKSAWPP